MGQLWSQQFSKNQPWEHCKTSPTNASKRLRMTSSSSSCPNYNNENPRLISALPDEISLQILARVPRTFYLTLKSVSRGWKSALTTPEIFQIRRELSTTEEWLYILTKGDDDKLSWHALDPINSIWQRLPHMPSIVQEEDLKRGLPGLVNSVIKNWFGGRKETLDRMPYCGCAIGVVNGCLYVLGGFSKASALKSVWRYDPTVNLWEEVSSMSTGRAFCKTSLLNNKLYVVGGVSKGRGGLTPLQSAEVYNPNTGTWDPVPSMPFSKAQTFPTAFLAELLKPIATGMTSYRGKLCVPQSLYSWPFFVDVGGEVFDPETNSWAEMPAGMGEGWPARQAGTKLSAVVNGELYALDPSNSSESGKIKMYDYNEDAWKVVVGKVPFREFTDSESPYLLAGFLGKLHVVAKDVNNDVSVLQAELKRSGLCGPHSGGESEMDIWKVIAAKRIAGVELVSCQVLNI